jgi:hypothetical protein
MDVDYPASVESVLQTVVHGAIHGPLSLGFRCLISRRAAEKLCVEDSRFSSKSCLQDIEFPNEKHPAVARSR